MSAYRTPPPFEPTKADRVLVAFCLLVFVALITYAILAAARVV